MNRLAAPGLLLILLLLLAAAAGAQGEPEAGPIPPGDGEIRVRVVRAGGSPAPGVAVVLYALPQDAAPGLARGTSDEAGLAVFSGVAPDPSISYLVGVRADGVPYGQRIAFEEGRKQAEVEVEVALTDADTSLARLGEGSVRIDRGCGALEVTETHPIANPSDRVLYVPPPERQQRQPVLVLELPLQAGPLRNPLGVVPEGLERDGRQLRFWGPVYPGSQELEFAYLLPDRGGDGSFSWRFPVGAPEQSWLAPEGLASLRSPELSPAEPRVLGEASYTVLRGGPLAPGAEVAVQASLGERDDAPFSALEARIMIELDDALLAASERHTIEVSGDAPLGPGPSPLLCVQLPPGADDVRLDPAAQAMSPVREPSGALAFYGPVPAGESTFVFSYRLALADADAVFTRSFALDLPLLEMIVSDTGVRPRTERLHRLRPIRNADRNYLHLQGFALEAGEELQVTFERLPVPRELPRLAATGFGLLAAGATFAFLMAPLRKAGVEVPQTSSRVEELVAERAAVYAVIRDLDEDFDTGKLSVEDHGTMRSELRARAVLLLQQERAARQEPEQATEQAPGCSACGEALPAQARFCPQCGAKTEAADA